MSTGIRNNGDMRVCCHANTSKGKGLHKNAEGVTYNVSVASIQDARNSEVAKSVRLAMIRGERHGMCVRCNTEDDSGIRSRRVYENQIWGSKVDLSYAKAHTAADGSINTAETPLLHMDVRFGNLCNLKCRMCGPTDSSQWYQEYYDTVGHGFHDTVGRIVLAPDAKGRIVAQNDPYKWSMTDPFWIEMDQTVLDHIEHIYFAGGEPLLFDKHYELLQRLIDRGRAGLVAIEYNTNLTNVPQRAWDIWKHFRVVSLGVSVDGFGPVNEYIRFPSKWKQIEANLDKVDAAEGNLEAWLATTVQIDNIMNLPELVKWKLSKNFKRVNRASSRFPFITAHPLHNPKHMNVQILPDWIKKAVHVVYDRFYDWYDANYYDENHRKLLHDLFDGYLKYMDSGRYDPEALAEFWRITKKTDEYRKQDFLKVDPLMARSILAHLRQSKLIGE